VGQTILSVQGGFGRHRRDRRSRLSGTCRAGPALREVDERRAKAKCKRQNCGDYTSRQSCLFKPGEPGRGPVTAYNGLQTNPGKQ